MSKREFLYDGLNEERLDKVLLDFVTHDPDIENITRSQIKKLIESDQVIVGEKIVSKAGVRVLPGKKITIKQLSTELSEIRPYDFPLDIVHEDEALLVVNKPCGLTVHPGAGNQDQTLVNAIVFYLSELEGKFPDNNRPGIVHRLDKDTTGLIVIAKNMKSLAHLSEQFSSRTIKRSYLALAYSTPRGRRKIDNSDSGVISAPIARDPHNKLKMSIVESGKTAITEWKVLERMSSAVLLELHLKTGRTHQIRCHMDHVGSPLLGDQIYGDTSNLPHRLKEAQIQFKRQALHAQELGFVHPTTGEDVHFQVDPPSDMLELIDLFRVSDS